MAQRAEERKYHFTYKVTCTYNDRVFFGVHSANSLEGFSGSGHLLSISKSEYGEEQHTFEIIQQYATRKEAKIAYNELKVGELQNPIRTEDKKFHFLYKTTRFDGKFYIGVHSTNVLDDKYKGSGVYLARSLKKYGWDKHERQILMMCATRQRAFQCEAITVTPEFLVENPLCMNKVAGGRQHGDRVYGVTEETRQKLSTASKAAVRTEEWCAKISKSNKGKAKPRTEEGDKAWREKNVGRKQTEEEIAARVAGQLSSEKFKNRYRPFTIDGVTYQNGREAVEALGIASGTLANRLRSPNWLNYQYLDAPKDPNAVSAKARGEYLRK